MKKTIAVSIVFGVSVGVYASTGSGVALPELAGALERILELVTGNIVKMILSISLAGVFIAMAFNRENGDMQKKLLVFAIAVGGLLGVTSLMNVLFDSTGQILSSANGVIG